MNEEQQEILRLMVVEKKNQTEVADVLGITQPAISKKMKEIRKIVGKAMGKT